MTALVTVPKYCDSRIERMGSATKLGPTQAELLEDLVGLSLRQIRLLEEIRDLLAALSGRDGEDARP